VYFWVDGIHVQARLEDDAQCLLVIIGATSEGKKELVGLIDGVRESAQSWKELLLVLRRRGLVMGPQLAVADDVLGFWHAIEEVWPKTRGQLWGTALYCTTVMRQAAVSFMRPSPWLAVRLGALLPWSLSGGLSAEADLLGELGIRAA
jgi:transposase-like protein